MSQPRLSTGRRTESDSPLRTRSWLVVILGRLIQGSRFDSTVTASSTTYIYIVPLSITKRIVKYGLQIIVYSTSLFNLYSANLNRNYESVTSAVLFHGAKIVIEDNATCRHCLLVIELSGDNVVHLPYFLCGYRCILWTILYIKLTLPIIQLSLFALFYWVWIIIQ